MVLNIKFRWGRQSSRAIRAQAGSGRAAGGGRRRIDSAPRSVGVRRAPRCAEPPASGRRPRAPPFADRISRRPSPVAGKLERPLSAN